MRGSILITALVLIGLAEGISAQQSRADSIQSVINTVKSDSVKLSLQIELAEIYLQTDAQKCLEHSKDAIVLAYELDEMWLVPYAYNYVGMSYDDLGKYTRALDAYQKAIDITHAEMQGNRDFERDYKLDLVVFLNNAGYSEFSRGNVSGAMEFYLKSLDYADSTASPDRSAVLGSIAELYYETGDLSNGKAYALEAFASAEEPGIAYYDASVLGQVMIGLGKPDSARTFFENWLHLPAGTLTTYDSALVYAGIGEALFSEGQIDSAASLYRESMILAQSLNNKLLQSELLAKQSELNKGIGRFAESEAQLTNAIDLAQSTASMLVLPRLYQRRAEVRALMGRAELALDDQRAAMALQDSVLQAFNSSYISQLIETRKALIKQQEADKISEELVASRIRAKNSRRFGLTMLMMAILVVILAYFLIRRQSGLNMPTAPVTVSRSGDVQSEFLIRVSLALLVLMVPLGVFHIVWRDYLGLTLVLIGGFASVSVYLLARANRLKAAALVMMVIAYPLVAVVPTDIEFNSMSILWVPATFIIISFAINEFKFQIVNGLLALVAYLVYLFRMTTAGYFGTQGFEAQLIIGLMAICAIFVALYYQRGRIFDYKFGLDSTTSFLRMIADSNPNFVFAKDLDRRYTFANKAMVDTYGLPFDQIIGKTPEEVNSAFTESEHFRRDDLEVMSDGVIKEIPAEKVYSEDGSIKWLHTVKKPIRDSKGKVVGMLGVATDITETRRTSIELQKSLSLLEATINSSADAILVVDMDRNIVLRNNKLIELWGEDMINEDMPNDERIRRASTKTKDPALFIKRVKEIINDPYAEITDIIEMKDGRILERYTRPQMIRDRVAGRIWSFRDITERERALRDLQISEERYRTSLEDNLFSILRVRHGQFLSVNKAFETLTGYSAEELQTVGLDQILHPEDKELFKEFIVRIISGQQIAGHVDCRVLRKNGSIRHVLASVKGYYDKNGEYLESTVTAADITQLKEVEAALARSEERYRSLVEASPDGILMADQNGLITFASNRLLEMAGTDSSGSPVGHHLMQFAVEHEMDRAQGDLAKVLTTGKPVFGRYLIKTGKEDRIHVELGGRLVQDQKGAPQGLILVMRDIEEQARAEQVLRESEERYRALFENTFDGFLIIDSSGRVDDINQSALELLQFQDNHKVIGRSVDTLFPGITDLPIYREILSGGSERSTQMRFEGRDSFDEPLFVELNLCVVVFNGERRVACSIKDVAERVVLETKEKELQNQVIELDALNRELVTHSIFNAQKNKLLTDILTDIDEARTRSSESSKQILEQTVRKIEANLNDHEDMDAFRIQFERIHPNFFKRLTDRCPKLTSHDLKYCAYIRLNMTTQDISNLLYVERKSVEMSKYRIKKKLGLDKDERLSKYLHSV